VNAPFLQGALLVMAATAKPSPIPISTQPFCGAETGLLVGCPKLDDAVFYEESSCYQEANASPSISVI
jgi:hypothetical protein